MSFIALSEVPVQNSMAPVVSGVSPWGGATGCRPSADYCVAAHPEDATVFVASPYGFGSEGIDEYDSVSGARLGRLPLPSAAYRCQSLAVSVTSAGAAYLCAVDAWGLLVVWSLDTRTSISTLQLSLPKVHKGGPPVIWSMAGTLGQTFPVLCFGYRFEGDGAGGGVRVVNIADPQHMAERAVGTRATIKRFRADNWAVLAMATHPTKALLAVAALDGTISIWDLAQPCRRHPTIWSAGKRGGNLSQMEESLHGRLTHIMATGTGRPPSTALSWSPWFDVLVTGSADGFITCWHAPSNVSRGHLGHIVCPEFNYVNASF